MLQNHPYASKVQRNYGSKTNNGQNFRNKATNIGTKFDMKYYELLLDATKHDEPVKKKGSHSVNSRRDSNGPIMLASS